MAPELKERIATAAGSNGRSMNAEIVERLEASFNPAIAPVTLAMTMANKDARIAELEFRVADLETAYSTLADQALALLREMEKHKLAQNLRDAAEQLEKAAIGDWGLGGLGKAPYTDIQLYNLWRKAEERRAKWRGLMADEKAYKAAKEAYEILLRPGPKVDPLE